MNDQGYNRWTNQEIEKHFEEVFATVENIKTKLKTN